MDQAGSLIHQVQNTVDGGIPVVHDMVFIVDRSEVNDIVNSVNSAADHFSVIQGTELFLAVFFFDFVQSGNSG